MAQNNQNDIVINAKANTKEAEANLKRLDTSIKELSKNNTGLNSLSTKLGNVGNKAAKSSQTGLFSSNKMTEMGFTGLQGSFMGVATKLGMIGLALATLTKAIQVMATAGRRTFEGLEANVQATGAAIDQLDGSAKGLLSELEKLSDLQKNNGSVDNTVLERQQAIIAQLGKSWGNLGLKINEATGEVTGFFTATGKIDSQVNTYKIDNAIAKVEVARRKLENAQRDFNNTTGGSKTGAAYGAAWVNRPGAMAQAMLGNALGAAGNALSGNNTFRTDNDVEVQQDVVDKARADLQQARTEVKQAEDELNRLKANLSPQELAILAARSKAMAEAQRGINGRDATEQQLILNLAQAQLGNGSLNEASRALNDYRVQKQQQRAATLSDAIDLDKALVDAAQKSYDKAMQGTDINKQTDAAVALNSAMQRLDGHIQELNQLGTGQVKPAEMRTGFIGTFDAFGLDALGQNNIQQQQLDVQKRIEKNTEKLGIPVVGE